MLVLVALPVQFSEHQLALTYPPTVTENFAEEGKASPHLGIVGLETNTPKFYVLAEHQIVLQLSTLSEALAVLTTTFSIANTQAVEKNFIIFRVLFLRCIAQDKHMLPQSTTQKLLQDFNSLCEMQTDYITDKMKTNIDFVIATMDETQSLSKHKVEESNHPIFVLDAPGSLIFLTNFRKTSGISFNLKTLHYVTPFCMIAVLNLSIIISGQLLGSLISTFSFQLFVDPVEAAILRLVHLVRYSTLTKNPPSIGFPLLHKYVFFSKFSYNGFPLH
ncbi:hypothetical protein AVEN_112719-1 [Araneus ventricosus]|uniref:Uncharacterized protein n=1 Tax=Araneus ventricosus TaxID=182803 RepID=A0A4Y2PJG2_ARAVE|nr:hypothetical protein AVEN_112719-1 [Araneus ventricosus]